MRHVLVPIDQFNEFLNWHNKNDEPFVSTLKPMHETAKKELYSQRLDSFIKSKRKRESKPIPVEIKFPPLAVDPNIQVSSAPGHVLQMHGNVSPQPSSGSRRTQYLFQTPKRTPPQMRGRRIFTPPRQSPPLVQQDDDGTDIQTESDEFEGFKVTGRTPGHIVKTPEGYALQTPVQRFEIPRVAYTPGQLSSLIRRSNLLEQEQDYRSPTAKKIDLNLNRFARSHEMYQRRQKANKLTTHIMKNYSQFGLTRTGEITNPTTNKPYRGSRAGDAKLAILKMLGSQVPYEPMGYHKFKERLQREPAIANEITEAQFKPSTWSLV